MIVTENIGGNDANIRKDVYGIGYYFCDNDVGNGN